MQFQFSVCMYGTCGRIDNKADFDFDFDSSQKNSNLTNKPSLVETQARTIINLQFKQFHHQITCVHFK